MNQPWERESMVAEDFENDLPELVDAFSDANSAKSQKEATQELFGILFKINDERKHIGEWRADLHGCWTRIFCLVIGFTFFRFFHPKNSQKIWQKFLDRCGLWWNKN